MSANSFKLCRNSFEFLSQCKFVSFKPCLIRKMSNQASDDNNPLLKTLKMFRDDLRDIVTRKKVEPTGKFPTHCDVLIVGGGVMGSSIAFWLKNRALEALKVAVIEKDPTVMLTDDNFDKLQYQQCTSTLSVGGLRQQFSIKENIELSLRSAEFFRNIKHYLNVEGCEPPDIQFHPSGYLFLATEKGASILEENCRLQRSLGAKVELISPEELKIRYPWLNTEGIALASHGLENEGWFDPYSLLFALKRKAVSLGTEYVSGEVIKFEEDIFTPVTGGKKVNTAIVKLPNGEEKSINFSLLIITAGGLSGNVARLIDDTGIIPPLPLEPRKRYVFVINCPNGPGVATPMVIDASGAYFRRDGLTDNYLCGISPPDNEEPPIDNLDVDYSFFEEKLWPILAHRVPGFEAAKRDEYIFRTSDGVYFTMRTGTRVPCISEFYRQRKETVDQWEQISLMSKVKSAWAGFYDFNRFDENAFIGPYPGCANVLVAAGFSGHGIQQAPAVGRAIMELIIEGEYLTVNLERFHMSRYVEGNPLWETNII